MNIKKKLLLLLVLTVLLERVFSQSDEFKLTNVKKEYIGTYIPVDLELRLYQSKKFYESLYASRKYGKTHPHDVLYLQENICYSDVAFHDGYAIDNKEFNDFKFITDNGAVFCIDNNGYLYRKISNSEYGYVDYVEYVMKILLSQNKNFNITIKGESLIIDGKEYKVNLDGAFLNTKNAAVWLYGDKHYVLVKNGDDGELYTGKEYDDRAGITRGDLVTRFPGLFKINQSEMPDYSGISKKNIRLFRNLIFARNGYSFDSKDLKNYFNTCSWYKANSKFNENNLRKDEKDFISLMKMYESK